MWISGKGGDDIMIKVDNISKSYYDKVAIDGVSLTVVPGQIQGLVGDNGAGKTTLIKCMAGIYKPEKGRIIFSGVGRDTTNEKSMIVDKGSNVATLTRADEKVTNVSAGKHAVEQEGIFDNPSLKEKIGYVSDNNEYIGRYTIKKMLKVYETYFPSFDIMHFSLLLESIIFPLIISFSVTFAYKTSLAQEYASFRVFKNPPRSLSYVT